jgi:NAD-dependent deacetylase
MFRAHPEITWKYLWEIGAACAGRTFNRAHEVMAEIERWKPGTWVLTQNVDGFHRAAGSRNLIEVHGDIFELRCLQCRARYSAEDLISGYRKAVRLPPACPACGGLVRPEVVLFEEALPEECVTAMRGLADSAWDLVVAVGTSAVFPYIAGPVLHAKAARVPTVEVNPGWTELSAHVDHRIVEAAAAAFGKLWDLLRSEGSRSEDHGRREVSNEPS